MEATLAHLSGESDMWNLKLSAHIMLHFKDIMGALTPFTSPEWFYYTAKDISVRVKIRGFPLDLRSTSRTPASPARYASGCDARSWRNGKNRDRERLQNF